MKEEEKQSNFKAAYILEYEGDGYAVMHYCDGSDFADPVTTKLWEEAKAALLALRAHLKIELNEIDL